MTSKNFSSPSIAILFNYLITCRRVLFSLLRDFFDFLNNPLGTFSYDFLHFSSWIYHLSDTFYRFLIPLRVISLAHRFYTKGEVTHFDAIAPGWVKLALFGDLF